MGGLSCEQRCNRSCQHNPAALLDLRCQCTADTTVHWSTWEAGCATQPLCGRDREQQLCTPLCTIRSIHYARAFHDAKLTNIITLLVARLQSRSHRHGLVANCQAEAGFFLVRLGRDGLADRRLRTKRSKQSELG